MLGAVALGNASRCDTFTSSGAGTDMAGMSMADTPSPLSDSAPSPAPHRDCSLPSAVLGCQGIACAIAAIATEATGLKSPVVASTAHDMRVERMVSVARAPDTPPPKA